MPSTFLGLNTGLSGLSYFQSALNTTSHNISNANTDGYSRQQILAKASNPLQEHHSYGMMGTGVSGQSINRLRNEFYDNKYWGANSDYNKYEAHRSNLAQLQTYMNEMTGDSGYTKWLSNMASTLQDVADNPGDYTTRISYTLTADGFTDMMNEMANNFQLTQKSINDEIELVVSEINSLAQQMYELTQQIINVELKGGNANDLRDKRGVCLDKLSEYVDVEVEEKSIMYGTGKDAVPSNAESMSVRINGFILVDEMEFNQLKVVPRKEAVNQTDVEGLVDVCWQNQDGTAGESFDSLSAGAKLQGLFEIRDGNNEENLNGVITEAGGTPPAIKVELPKSVHINNLNIPTQGTITLNGKDYMYDGWSAEYDADGNLNNFQFTNVTMLNEHDVEISAVFPDNIVGCYARMGDTIDVKGIPYYMARLNEMVRTFSDYMNDIVVEGVDENGDPGLDMFTAVDPYGNDYVFKGSMAGTGTVSSTDSTYYKLTALNWELNSEWKKDPAKVVVSYAEDIEQGNIEARPIIDKIIFGMTDATMYSQGTVSHFMQAVTTNLAVDISKSETFCTNQDDIRYTIDNQRASVSGVDSNEEASDLVKFENLYNLASQVISTLNEVYDKLINQTGV